MSAADNDWKLLLSRVLDGEELTDEELAPLNEALSDPTNRAAANKLMQLEAIKG